MTNITADIEQLLAELVQITSRIATLVNMTNGINSTNDDDNENSLASTANSLALSATIISVAAFFIAILQAILEYSGSGESARRRCDHAAIGPFADHVHKRWSFRHWRRQYYYPEVFVKFSIKKEDEGPQSPPDEQRPKRKLTNSKLIYILSVLRWKFFVDAPRSISQSTLGRQVSLLLEKSVSNLQRARRNFPLSSPPRATWARLLSLAGKEDMQVMRFKDYIDIDSVPGSLDVPTQTVDLVELGKLFIALGGDRVQMDVLNTKFDAYGRIGSITIEDFSGFGKVLKFQEYERAGSPTLSTSEEMRKVTMSLIEGNLTIGATPDAETEEFQRKWDTVEERDDGDLMVAALYRNWNEKPSADGDRIYKTIMNISKERLSIIITDWQNSRLKWKDFRAFPAVLFRLAMADFSCSPAGYPALSLLTPFLVQCRQMAHDVCQIYDLTLFSTRSNKSNKSNDSHNYDEYDESDDDDFLGELIARIEKTGSGLRLITPEVSFWGGTNTFTSMIIRSRKPHAFLLSRPSLSHGRVILPPIADLIKDYDPRLWARSSRISSSKPKGDTHLARELLMTQMLILHVSIKHMLLNISILWWGDRLSSLTHDSFTIVLHYMRSTIIECSITRGEDGTELFRKLDEAIHHKLTKDGTFKPNTPLEDITLLANYIKVRILVYAAYLILIPDTSEIMNAEWTVDYKGFVLPMI